MKILITGDRNWDINPEIRKERIKDILEKMIRFSELDPQNITIIHGAARGVDTLAGQAADELGMKVKSYPANWERYGRAAGPIRNRQMLGEKPDLVLGFHNDLSKSKGTADCVKEADKRGFPVMVFRESADEGGG